MREKELLKRIAPLVLGGLALALGGCGSPQEREARHLRRGDGYLAVNNLAKARIEFRVALQIMPRDAMARYENGVVEERSGSFAKAVAFYQTALEADAGHVPTRVALARLTLLAGSPQVAAGILQPAFLKQPDDPHVLAVRAACESALHDPVAALADAEHAVRLEPDNIDAIAVLAGIYQAAGDGEKARALLESTVRKVPDNVELRLMLFHTYDSLHLDPQAEATLVELTKLRPTDPAHRIRLAQYYTRTKRPDAAETTLRAGIKAMPHAPELRHALIDALANARGRDVAARELASEIAAEPDDSSLRFEAARFHESGKEYAQAERDYREVIARSKFDASGLRARNRLAALKFALNDFSGARVLVEEVLASSPRDDDALTLRGNITLQEDTDPKSAIADLRAVLRDQPNAVGVMRSLARAHVANGEPDLAAQILRSAIEANPGDTAVRLDLAQLMAQTGGAQQAKPLIDELARQQPGSAEVLDTQFRIALATGDSATAQAAADALVLAQPQSSVGYLYQGLVEEGAGRLEEAAKLYGKALERQPEAVEPLRRLATVLTRLQRVPEAVKRLEAVTQRFPDSIAAAVIEGDLYMSVQQPSAAIQVFRSILQRDPRSVIGYTQLATAQLAAHDAAAAIATLQEGVQKSSDPDPLRVSLATLYDAQGQAESAARIYEAMLQRNPRADVAANNLAMLLVNHHADAASLERAAQLTTRFAQSTDPNFLDTYGWVLYKRGEAAAAVVALRSVVAKAPESAIGRYHLGMAQVLAGQVDGARDNLSHALQSGKAFPGMDEAKQALQRLAANPTSPKS